MLEWVVSPQESGSKLISFLSRHLGDTYSSRYLKRAIEGNCCRINRRVERFASTLLGTGDLVSLVLEPSLVSFPYRVEPTRILFEDEDLLAYDKPAGVSCDEEGMIALFKPSHPSIRLIHRLDRQTTGVLLLAKNALAFDSLVKQFKQLLVHKSYLALVDGVMPKSQGVIENYLGKKRTYAGQAIWGEVKPVNGLYACTEWKCLKKGKTASCIQCLPKTGRTHQIRVHLSEMGHPILGDYQYGKRFECPYKAKRYLLHAEEIEFVHPRTNVRIRLKALLPDDFLMAQKELFNS
ncbi:RNA pseudouridylate synthase family protein [Candidatus Protochlamydia naegleriophila]|uniref:Pseudouridine synthase n=1 Tax=Candidatus Protochlamydia naegleriophila TaxID=389348 RepID=A0A0U5JES4_9BACT|nr:RluA family pseudouridine synthase [Candidatus Protochlamydia naegleriophila]CUI17090.1 RNA pseudouridylate synthase family protein [Candidatus Protochlamydia naegleriophila]